MRFPVLIAACLLPASAAADAIAPAGPTAAASADVRDVALMLDGGPLHLRFRMSLGGRSLSERRAAFVDRLITTLDRDGDGVVSRAEARATPLLATRRREKANAFLASLGEQGTVPRSELEASVARVGGAPVVYRQDKSVAGKDLDVFKALDADGSGALEPGEMARAALRILEKDTDRDECVTFEEFVPPPMPDPNQVVTTFPGESPDEPRPTVAEDLRDSAEPLLPRRLVARYDRNRDAKLSAKELGWPADRVATLDANRDGGLDAVELRRFGETPVDLELAVDLAPGPGTPPLAVLAVGGGRAADADRPDFVRLDVGETALTISFRDHDPVEAAVENALAEFNRMDVDANGYLDAAEASTRTRFERGLFDTIDADADGKLFAEEMETYVRLRAEPSATSAQVNLYDGGRGFFQVLDSNGDGRVSVREMRAAEASLKSARKRGDGPLSPNDPTPSFHIEFVRGAYQLFGRAELMTVRSAASVRPTTAGPVWFRRMDRNNDGDLTWNEFLGPRPVFQRLDADADGLIDPREAEATGL